MFVQVINKKPHKLLRMDHKIHKPCKFCSSRVYFLALFFWTKILGHAVGFKSALGSRIQNFFAASNATNWLRSLQLAHEEAQTQA